MLKGLAQRICLLILVPMAFPSHLREIAEYAVARTVISAAKNVEKQFKINKRCLATGRVRAAQRNCS